MTMPDATDTVAAPATTAAAKHAVPPPPAGAQTPDGVFLIHGLGGTQYDLGSMHKRLKNAGLVTHSLTLPGHGTKPEDLVGVTAEDWIDAVVTKYREIRDAHPTLHLMGMCPRHLQFGAHQMMHTLTVQYRDELRRPVQLLG